MAKLCANADGSFTASIWGVLSSTADNDIETAATALTAANQDSNTFIPTAVAIDAILIKVGSRAAGSPSNTISVVLRNSTTATDIATVTINVSDIPVCDTTQRDGGWVCFKLGSTHTPNGTDSYLIRARLSSTSTGVSLWRGSGTDWARQVRQTTTQAPAAGDRLFIAKEWTAAATGTARSITMNNTASTLFGASTSPSLSTSTAVGASVCVCLGGTLTWGNTAATNYLLNVIGSVVIFSGGTYTCGGSGSEIPRDSTAILEFQPAVTADSRFICCAGSTVSVRGLSRTSGKDFAWCLLNTDEAAAQTVLGVDTDTGWKSGDTIAIASTSRTNTESETRTLSGDAGATTMTVSSGLTNAHKGSASDGMQAEVINLTRNVIIRTNNSARLTTIEVYSTTTAFFSWVNCLYHGAAISQTNLDTTTGSVTFQYCAFQEHGASFAALRTSGTTWNNVTVSYCVAYSVNAGQFISVANTTGTSYTFDNCVSIRGSGFSFNDLGGTITNIRATAASGVGITVSDANGFTGTCNNWIAHSCISGGLSITGQIQNKTVSNLVAWRNSSTGIAWNGASANPFHQAIVEDLISFGNSTSNMTISTLNGKLILKNPIIAGDTSFSVGTGLVLSSSTGLTGHLVIQGGIFGGGGGTKTTHTTVDISITTALAITWLDMIGTQLLSATEISGETNPNVGSRYSWQNPDGSIANSRTYYTKVGEVRYETSVVHGTVSEKLTPIETVGSILCSSPKRVAVNNTDTVTMKVWVRKSAAFNGTIGPRMIVRANPAIGIDDDTVLDTISVAADTWEQLSGTTAAVTGKGVLEFCVQVNGTAGVGYCDTWEAS